MRASRGTNVMVSLKLPHHVEDLSTPLLAIESVRRYVWESRYGSILIEVLGDDVFVNGLRVEPHTQ